MPGPRFISLLSLSFVFDPFRYLCVLFPLIEVGYHRSLPFLTMGKKRSAEEYRQAAEANGWVEGAHKEKNRVVPEQDEPSGRYKMNQQKALDQ